VTAVILGMKLDITFVTQVSFMIDSCMYDSMDIFKRT